MRKWKVGDFIERREGLRKPTHVFWIGIIIQQHLGQQHKTVKVALHHLDVGYNLATTFYDVVEDRHFHKFKPTKLEYDKIKEAIEESFAKEQMDNLSYIAALDKLNKNDKHHKTRTRTI